MTSAAMKAPLARWAGRMLGATVLAALAAPALAAPVDLFYERTVMTAADDRCRLFEPDLAVALLAAQVQARGAALRSGLDEAMVGGVEQRARAAAAQVACDAPDMAMVADRVRAAFESYAKLARMTYPGELADWRADRGTGRAARWRLAQNAASGWDRVIFGLAGRQGADGLMALGMFADGREPYSARLVMRDVRKTLGPYIDTREKDPKRRPALARRMPPDGAVVVYAAEARSPAGTDLLPKGARSGWAFRFPAEAAAAMARLDPREAVAVEFVFGGSRDEVRRVYIEVGDFAAGRAFLRTTR